MRGHAELEIGEALLLRIVGEGRGRDDKALQVDRDARLARIGKGFPDEALEGQGDFLDFSCSIRNAQQQRIGAVTRQHVKRVGGGVDGIEYAIFFRRHQNPGGRERLAGVDAENLKGRRVLVRQEINRVARRICRGDVIRASNKRCPLHIRIVHL